MRRCLQYIMVLTLAVLFYSCSPSRKAVRNITPPDAIPSYVSDYLNRYSALAVSEMKRTGIPASITLAQGMLESDYGRSTLARKSNNHFGIKCHNDWNGSKVYHDDNRKGECFRAYRSPEDSYRDHSDFLVNGSRYRDLFRLSSGDYKGWAHGLKKAGYATDPRYPEHLINKIEQYRLYIYDTGKGFPAMTAQQAKEGQAQVPAGKPAEVVPPVINGSKEPGQKESSTVSQAAEETEEPIKVISLGSGKIKMNNDVQYIIAEDGDTFESLAEKYQLLSWEISRYNDLAPDASLVPGQVVYLQPKKTRAAKGLLVYTVSDGETMHSVSQKFAVKLSSLYKMNVMEDGSECQPGQKLRIR